MATVDMSSLVQLRWTSEARVDITDVTFRRPSVASSPEMSPFCPIRCHHSDSGCHHPAAMSPYWRQDVNHDTRMSTLDGKCQACTSGCQAWRENVKLACQNVKPLALKVDINDLLPPPKHSKVDIFRPRSARRWTWISHPRLGFGTPDVHIHPQTPLQMSTFDPDVHLGGLLPS